MVAKQSIQKLLLRKSINSDTGRFGRYNNGLGIDQMFLAQKLKAYKIKTQSVRGDNSEGILKGYKFEDFEEPIARYLPNLSEVKEDPPEQDELFE
jgi:hypothetical protein